MLEGCVRQEAREDEDERTVGVGWTWYVFGNMASESCRRLVLSAFSPSKHTHVNDGAEQRSVLRVRADPDPRRRAGEACKLRERVV
jgi:hypothetical protein